MEPLVAQIWMLLHDDGEREDLELHELQPMLLPVATIQWPNKDSGPVQAQAAEAPPTGQATGVAAPAQARAQTQIQVQAPAALAPAPALPSAVSAPPAASDHTAASAPIAPIVTTTAAAHALTGLHAAELRQQLV